MKVPLAALLMGALLSASQASSQPPVTLVLCAPGYPGTTAEAQPAMDALAAAVAAAAGWKAGELRAIYFETEQPGIARLSEPDAAIALMPLPLWLEHRQQLKLAPRLQAIEQQGRAAESWSLVAATGAVTGPASLAGFEVLSSAGYSPRFVRGPILASWGEVPPSATISDSSAVLTALRRAAAGNKVAVVLDREQAAAVPALPFASRLQVVTRSAPLPVSVLSVVNGRLSLARTTSLMRGFTTLATSRAGAAALAGVQMAGFVPADQAALARVSAEFERVR